VSCAYLLLLGNNQKEVSEATDVGDRTIRDWIKTPWWTKAQDEARDRWLHGVQGRAMNGIIEALDDPNEYAAMARYVADRILPEMAPPKQRQEHTGKDGAPIAVGLSDAIADDIRRKVLGIEHDVPGDKPKR
jgi:hypothetical protein